MSWENQRVKIRNMILNHEQLVEQLFFRACEILNQRNLAYHPMVRIKSQSADCRTKAKSRILGYTNLKKRVVVIDIFTPKKGKNKSYNSILRVIAHEIAHYQKPPYRQRYKGHLIFRKHFPVFYRQVKRNVEKFKKDGILGRYFK